MVASRSLVLLLIELGVVLMSVREVGVSVSVMNKEELINKIHDFVDEYEKDFAIPVPLFVVNRRFGLTCKRVTGVTLLVLLEAHPDDFTLLLTRSGGRSVTSLRL